MKNTPQEIIELMQAVIGGHREFEYFNSGIGEWMGCRMFSDFEKYKYRITQPPKKKVKLYQWLCYCESVGHYVSQHVEKKPVNITDVIRRLDETMKEVEV